MTKKCAAGVAGPVVIGVGAGVFFFVVVVVVFFVVVPFDPAADAEPATSTASVAPRQNVTSVIAVTAAAWRRGRRLLTTHLPCRSPVPPGSRSLRGAGRAALRSRCAPPALRGPRSSAEGRRREEADRR